MAVSETSNSSATIERYTFIAIGVAIILFIIGWTIYHLVKMSNQHFFFLAVLGVIAIGFLIAGAVI
jgi:hypothetical protein